MTWLISVVKRAARGVPLGQASMENIGYLLMSVAVAGFMPAAVAYTVDFVDAAAWAIFGDYIAEVFAGGLSVFAFLGLISVKVPGGAAVAVPVILMMLLAILGLWVMLIVRDAMILMGLIFGPLVFSGLVDRDLWGHTRKWVGVMGGVIASKLGIFLALALAGALLDGALDVSEIPSTRAIGSVITFLALLFMALIMPFQLAKWLPLVGDEIQSMHQVKSEAAQRHRGHKSGMKGKDDMKARAANKSSAGGGGGGAGAGAGGAAGAAAGPAAAAMAVKQAVDGVRDQTVQAAQDGARNASGDGGQQGDSGSGGESGRGSGSSGDVPGKGGGSSRGGSPGGSGGSAGGGGARRPTPPPPRAGARPGARPNPPPPPSRPAGPAPPPPPAPASPPPPPDHVTAVLPPPPTH
ncbi:hypothetical protein ADZ36_05950 [Streptomyces fradiae]|uniref:Uncharacterized protein n=2 Tax=Streptomyces TaxID=1883 RepID=A0A3R7EN65_9ACTN|nr:hypothetical protein ADZ36_05950 [Streptomyces fradiae]RKM92663.1 hypothetical protein SFRA_024115 [Streptomyces xinghaiensis]RNC70632.1 hypothetical protein DC095_025105 [Streptomyces xinghaiensis]